MLRLVKTRQLQIVHSHPNRMPMPAIGRIPFGQGTGEAGRFWQELGGQVGYKGASNRFLRRNDHGAWLYGAEKRPYLCACKYGTI